MHFSEELPLEDCLVDCCWYENGKIYVQVVPGNHARVKKFHSHSIVFDTSEFVKKYNVARKKFGVECWIRLPGKYDQFEETSYIKLS